MVAFLDSAERGCEAARQALRSEYGSFADKLFGGPAERGLAEKLFGGAGSASLERGFAVASADAEAKLAARLAGIVVADARRFTLAVTGQSNAAGHGGYFDETYTFATARAAHAGFAAAGLTLAVQNFAIGGGRTLPTTGWCGEAQVGPAVDLAVWDFTMSVCRLILCMPLQLNN